MSLIDKSTLITQLAPPLDGLLATQLLDEFVSIERRYVLRDWEPAELDGGQFSEILARVIYHMDSGTLNLHKEFDECLNYVENDKVVHKVVPRRDALHIAKVLRTTYKFRSQRGAIHISPNYTANHMDARFIVEAARWCMNETLRVFWNHDREIVAKAIRELLHFDVPCIGKYQDVLLVQRTDLKAEEEILVLLHYAGEAGFTRRELGQHGRCSPASITLALQALTSHQCRQVVEVGDRYRLSDLGSKRIREELSEKLLLE